MKTFIFATGLVFFLQCGTGNLLAQKHPKTVITNIKEVKEKLIINYDIVDAYPEQLFTISAVMETSSGKIIKPVHITGDVNKQLVGESGYRIIWDLKADEIYLDESVDIQLLTDVSVDLNYYSIGKLMLSSTLFPGSGLFKLNRAGGTYMFGVIGYGSLIASGVFWSKSNKAYDDYKSATTESGRDDYYEQMEKFDKLFTYSAIGAASMWVISYIALASKWNKLKKKNTTGALYNKKFNFYANYHPVFNKPLFTLSYRF